MLTEEQILKIAEVCHEANRAYCRVLGDDSQLPWAEAPDWQKDSALEGVLFHLEHPTAIDSASHDNWMRMKEKEGWVYGVVKDAAAKTHPCMVPFEQLPPEQQIKDSLFIAVGRAMAPVFIITNEGFDKAATNHNFVVGHIALRSNQAALVIESGAPTETGDTPLTGFTRVPKMSGPAGLLIEGINRTLQVDSGMGHMFLQTGMELFAGAQIATGKEGADDGQVNVEAESQG